jgi:uncharacterized protein (TIGR02611 family)
MGGTTGVGERAASQVDARGDTPALEVVERPEGSIHPLLDRLRIHPVTLRGIRVGHVFRDRLHRPMRAHPVLGLPYRILVAVIGTVLVLVGLVLVPAPGPGWLIVLTGLAVLAGEFAWARRLLHFTRRRLADWTRWVLRQPVLVRVAFGSLGLVTTIVGFYLSMKMSQWNGLPSA